MLKAVGLDVTMVGSACAPARMWYTVMSSDVKAFESAPMALIAALYFSVGNWAVPRNIMCSKKCANPDLPGSTSLRLPVRTME